MAANRHVNATVPGHGAVAVTPSDSTIISVTRSLYVGTAGSVAVRMADGQTVTFANFLGGILPIQVDRVLSTGTGAANIVALY